MKTTYIIAVSGGVDSIVLLDMLAKKTDRPIIVAHFDHGIRDDSASDALFVSQLADRYGFRFQSRREELGVVASEDSARTRRYLYLRSLAKKFDGTIVTAHHGDDIIESVAINFTRGTGWRGLAVLDSDIYRPLLGHSKSEIISYAQKHQLEWREDSTNASDAYLRNRLRRKTGLLSPDAKREVLALRAQQIDTKRQIETISNALIGSGPAYSRYFFTHIPPAVAIECLRQVTRGALTRPQMERALLAIKTAKPK
jgi:tRNA(Ile)-lysidine synthetase-like protein